MFWKEWDGFLLELPSCRINAAAKEFCRAPCSGFALSRFSCISLFLMQRVRVIDSHTGGEPTRVVVAGGPDLGGGTVADKLKVFRSEHDRFRSAVVNEPRGSDVLVGALLVEPSDRSCQAGVIFFNNVGYLGMCGHGTIGLVVTLAHLGRLRTGEHRIETPVGVVTATLHP